MSEIKSEKTFIICEKKVLIYGAGNVGMQVYKTICRHNISVCGFIDQRILDSFYSLPVYTLKELEPFDKKEQYLVIITIKNVFQHTEIAQSLRAIGFNNILFKPLGILYGTNHNNILKQIDYVYDLLVEQEKIVFEQISPISGIKLLDFYDSAIIKDAGDYYIANLPAELFFTNNQYVSEWGDANLLSSYPSVDMFKGFSSCDPLDFAKNVNEYIDKIARPGAEKEGIDTSGNWGAHVIEGRQRVFFEMKKRLALDNLFFQKNCVTVKKDLYNKLHLISSGKNRICFLINEGYQYLPARISKSDYEEYLNRKDLDQLLDYITNSGEELFAPVPHPYFYNYCYKAPNYTMIWIMKIARYLSKTLYKEYHLDYSSIQVLDMLDDQGTTSRFFFILGYSVKRIYEKKEKIAGLIDALLSINDIAESKVINQSADILLISSKQETSDELEIILKSIKKYCFIQVWNRNESILNFVRENGFSLEEKIFTTIWGNEYVEGYIFKYNKSR